MLGQLFHHRFVWLANRTFSSYRKITKSPERYRMVNILQVAFEIARAVGLIQDRYFSFEGRSLRFRVSENLVKIKKVAQVLEVLKKEGIISSIWAGRVYYRAGVTGKEVTEAIVKKLKEIKGYGEIDEGKAIRALQSKAFRDVFVPAGKRSPFHDASHYMVTWGLYNRVLLHDLAINVICGRELYQHKLEEAEEVSDEAGKRNGKLKAVFDEAKRILQSGDFKIRGDFSPNGIRKIAESLARMMDYEEIKWQLQADNLEEIKPLEREDGQPMPKYAFVISDIHLREFHHENMEELLRFVWMVKKLNGRIILNGDTFDVWREKELQKILGENTRFVNALTKLRETVIIAGNHDNFLEKFAQRGGILLNPNFPVKLSYISSDRRIKIFHGHQFDPFNRPGARLGRWATRGVTGLEKLSKIKKIFGYLKFFPFTLLKPLGDLLGYLFGPRLSARLLLLPKILLPTEYVLKRKVENIMAWLDSEIKIAETVDKINLSDVSEDEPLTFIIGHLHYEGISNLTERVNEAVKEKYGGKVKLIITDSWEYSEGYAGDYVVITDSGTTEAGRVAVVKEIWETTADWREKNIKYFCPLIAMVAERSQPRLQ